MKVFVLMLAATAIAGCTPTVKMSNEHGVAIHALGISDASAAAEVECKKYGRLPRFSAELRGSVYSFDCVE
jgi:hypothetical protein